jgi:hypothetical protein
MYVLFLSITICSPMIFKVDSRLVKEAYTQLKTKVLRMAGEKESLDEMFANVTIGDDSEIGCYPIVVYIDEAHEIGRSDIWMDSIVLLRISSKKKSSAYMSTTSGINHLAATSIGRALYVFIIDGRN